MPKLPPAAISSKQPQHSAGGKPKRNLSPFFQELSLVSSVFPFLAFYTFSYFVSVVDGSTRSTHLWLLTIALCVTTMACAILFFATCIDDGISEARLRATEFTASRSKSLAKFERDDCENRDTFHNRIIDTCSTPDASTDGKKNFFEQKHDQRGNALKHHPSLTSPDIC